MTGEELRAWRETLGLTQAQLGLAIERPATTISRWERGTVGIESPGVLRFLLVALYREKIRYGADHAGFVASLPAFLYSGGLASARDDGALGPAFSGRSRRQRRSRPSRIHVSATRARRRAGNHRPRTARPQRTVRESAG